MGDAVARRFDLAAEIPLRARLFRVGDDEHVLVAVVHHIAADGWSIAPLVADLGVAYAGRCGGAGPGLGAVGGAVCGLHAVAARAAWAILTIPHSRIARAAGLLGGGVGRDCPSGWQLPTDRPYPAVADYRGATVAVEWPAELQQRVARVAREHNATSFMVVQAALGGAVGQAQRQF